MVAFDPRRQVEGGSRTLPLPFKRPSIDLDRSLRQWAHVRADQIGVGDIIAEFGRVDQLKQIRLLDPVSVEIHVLNEMTKATRRMYASAIVFAFTTARAEA